MMEETFKVSLAAMRKMAWSENEGRGTSEEDIVETEMRDDER